MAQALEKFHILIWLVMTWVRVCANLHQDTYFRSVHFAVCEINYSCFSCWQSKASLRDCPAFAHAALCPGTLSLSSTCDIAFLLSMTTAATPIQFQHLLRFPLTSARPPRSYAVSSLKSELRPCSSSSRSMNLAVLNKHLMGGANQRRAPGLCGGLTCGLQAQGHSSGVLPRAII